MRTVQCKKITRVYRMLPPCADLQKRESRWPAAIGDGGMRGVEG